MPAILLIVGAIIVVGAIALAFLPAEAPTTTPEPIPVTETVPEDTATKTPTTQPAISKTESETVETTPPPVVIKEPPKNPTAAPDPVPTAPASDYQNGTYSTTFEYKVPSGHQEPITVALTLENDIITAATLEFGGVVGTSRLYQGKFTAAYEAEVIGKDIDTINLSRVGGASLTSKAFNEAIAKVKADAAS